MGTYSILVDVGVLFPDLYKASKNDDSEVLESREKPCLDLLENQQRIYVASPSMGLYTMNFLKKPHHIALGFGNGRFNVHNTQTTKQTHSVQAYRMPVTCIRDYVGSSQHRIVAGTVYLVHPQMYYLSFNPLDLFHIPLQGVPLSLRDL
eukprot:sb/3473656/